MSSKDMRKLMECLNEAVTSPIAGQWPDTTYNGQPIFDAYVEFVGKQNNDDKQEVYLGYSPSKNEFVIGYDMWNYYGGHFGTQTATFIDGKFYGDELETHNEAYTEDDETVMFYHQEGGYGYVHTIYPDIIDLRLD